MCLNMDRNTPWVQSQAWSSSTTSRGTCAMLRGRRGDFGQRPRRSCALLPQATPLLFQSTNWQRTDPVVVKLPPGQTRRRRLPGAPPRTRRCCAGPICRPLEFVESKRSPSQPPLHSRSHSGAIETKHYSVRIDPETGALVSLKLKPSGREMLGGPANVLIAEKPKRQEGDPGDSIVDRHERERLATSLQFKPKITVTAGPLATTVEVQSEFFGGGPCRRVMRFYADFPRIDFETELNDIPDRTVVVAEFPLAEAITEVRRGIPYGFSHGAWAKPNPELHGWTRHRPRRALVTLHARQRRRRGDSRPRAFGTRTHRPDADSVSSQRATNTTATRTPG